MHPNNEILASTVLLVIFSHALGGHADLNSNPFQVCALNEVYIQQERGHIPLDFKPPSRIGGSRKNTPELGASGLGSAAATTPITCNAGNASSQACYTATQQGRAK